MAQSSIGVSTTLTWQVFFSIRVAQVVGDQLVVVLGVGRRRGDQLRQAAGGAAAGELQQRLRLGHRQAADLVGDQPGLARRGAQVAGAGADGRRLGVRRGGHEALSAALLPLPECARKVRVGANSPSLWPTIDSETNTGT